MQDGQIDLDLLRALALLLEERSVARAADRFALSPSAMSRALKRLRNAFGDELLVATPAGYELTPRARQIEIELPSLLQHFRSLVVVEPFDPAGSTDAVRMHASDYACAVLLPEVFVAIAREAPRLKLSIEPLTPHTFEDIAQGRVDVALTPVQPPAPLRLTRLYQDEYLGVVSADHPLRADQLALQDLRRWPYIRVLALPERLMVADQRLHDLGVHPQSVLQVPYFSAALAALPGTTSIALIPRRLAHQHRHDGRLRTVRAPTEFEPFAYGMVWHPRTAAYPAQAWVRSLLVTAGARLGDL